MYDLNGRGEKTITVLNKTYRKQPQNDGLMKTNEMVPKEIVYF